MTPIEIIALIILFFGAIKILILLVNPKSWMDFSKKMFKSNNGVQIAGIIIAALVLYYLILDGITIVQILAVHAFIGALMMIGLAGYLPQLVKAYDEQIRKGNFWKDNWLYLMIWIAILIWAAIVLLG